MQSTTYVVVHLQYVRFDFSIQLVDGKADQWEFMPIIEEHNQELDPERESTVIEESLQEYGYQYIRLMVGSVQVTFIQAFYLNLMDFFLGFVFALLLRVIMCHPSYHVRVRLSCYLIISSYVSFHRILVMFVSGL